MGIIGNMGAQSEIAYGEDGLNKLDELDGEFFTYPKLPNFPILNYQLSIINSPYPHARKRYYKTNAQTDKFIIFEKIFISLSMQRG